MVVLGIIKVVAESKFRCDRWVVRRAQLGLERGCGLLRLIKIRLALQIKARSVLGAKIVALPHALRWVMTFPESCQQHF